MKMLPMPTSCPSIHPTKQNTTPPKSHDWMMWVCVIRSSEGCGWAGQSWNWELMRWELGGGLTVWTLNKSLWWGWGELIGWLIISPFIACLSWFYHNHIIINNNQASRHLCLTLLPCPAHPTILSQSQLEKQSLQISRTKNGYCISLTYSVIYWRGMRTWLVDILIWEITKMENTHSAIPDCPWMQIGGAYIIENTRREREAPQFRNPSLV